MQLNTWRQVVVLIVGDALTGAFAGFFAFAAVTTPAAGKRALAIVMAVLFGLLTAALISGTWAATQPRALVAGPAGLRFESARRPWQLRWDELVSLRIETGYQLLARGVLLVPQRWRRTYVVRLIMTPTPGKHEADAMLNRRFRGKWGAAPDSWSFPFGSARELVAPLDAALRADAGERYAGTVDAGRLPPGLL